MKYEGSFELYPTGSETNQSEKSAPDPYQNGLDYNTDKNAHDQELNDRLEKRNWPK
jgi:hypothetical protein